MRITLVLAATLWLFDGVAGDMVQFNGSVIDGCCPTAGKNSPDGKVVWNECVVISTSSL